MVRHPRTGSRVPVQLAIEVRWKSSAGGYRKITGKTDNISGNGMFMAVPVRLRRETPISITVSLPEEVTRVPLELRCHGRVVRWSKAGERAGIAATIDQYELRPARRQG